MNRMSKSSVRSVVNKSRKPVMGGREAVKVAIVQQPSVYLDREGCVRRADELIHEAAANGAELVAFPEVWLAGYPYWSEGWEVETERWVQGRLRFRDAAVTVPSEDTEAIGLAARNANVVVVLGCNELDSRPEADAIYNSLLFFDRDGSLLGSHRKLVPTAVERQFWGRGDEADLQMVFETDIGRIGGLCCGEHTMTLARALAMSQGEDFHIAAFPGAFSLKGKRLQEFDTDGTFIGQSLSRAHAIESGAFVLLTCGYTEEADIPEDFVWKGQDNMNISWARGGSTVIGPLGVPLAGPSPEAGIVYAECHAWMIKAHNAILDTCGHYARPDLLRLMVRAEAGWQRTGTPRFSELPRDGLLRAAERHDVDGEVVVEVAAGMDERSAASSGQSIRA